MARTQWAVLIAFGVIATLAIAATTFVFCPKDASRKRARPNIDATRLTHEKSIVGSWKRVTLPEDKNDDVHGWRQINAAGKMLTLYGDVILDGSYKLIDKKTIETATHRYGKDDAVDLWTFGFLDGKLIMIHNEYGWVEAYESVPADSLHPRLDP